MTKHRSPANPDERKAAGKVLRDRLPRAAHAEWRPEGKARDVIALLDVSNRGRVKSLVPIRYGRMSHSPFAFLRGAAQVMAKDLARTAVTGLRVQACGDAHLMNFGGFATPERQFVFDVNDFDETLPAPWEWDIKRLAASVIVAARYLGLPSAQCSRATTASVAAYRKAMTGYAELGALEMWYQRTDGRAVSEIAPATRSRSIDLAAQPVSRHHFPDITGHGGNMLIKDEPPLVFHPHKSDRIVDHVLQFIRQYRQTLTEDRRVLLERYQLVDVAVKVVGVGSVGTRCAIGLFTAGEDDLMFLQFKEARASVLAPYAGRSRYRNNGQRVVEGQRLMQSASDIFLGWSSIPDIGADFYVRQLHDHKSAANIDEMDFKYLLDYVGHCGHTLARAHAKAGDAAAISGYLGKGDRFDIAVSSFAESYADQTEADFDTFKSAIKAGRISVEDA